MKEVALFLSFLSLAVVVFAVVGIIVKLFRSFFPKKSVEKPSHTEPPNYPESSSSWGEMSHAERTFILSRYTHLDERSIFAANLARPKMEEGNPVRAQDEHSILASELAELGRTRYPVKRVYYASKHRNEFWNAVQCATEFTLEFLKGGTWVPGMKEFRSDIYPNGSLMVFDARTGAEARKKKRNVRIVVHRDAVPEV